MKSLFNLKKETHFVIFVFLLAYILRMAYMAFLQTNYFFYNHPSSDVLYYQEWAHDIAKGNWIGTRTFYGLPLYPYFLAVLERLTLGNMLLMRVIHIIMGSLNCVLLYFVTKRLFSTKVAVLASLLASTNFILIYYDWIMMPVTLNISLSLILLYGFLQIETVKHRRELFYLGLIFGLGICGDPKLLFFFSFIIAAAFFKPSPVSFKEKVRPFFPIVIGVTLILSTVVMRNKIVGGDWIFLSAQSGLSFYVGNNRRANGMFENPEFIRPSHTGQDEDQKIAAEQVLGKDLSPKEVSRFWRNRGLLFIREHPWDYIKLLGKKLTIFFSDDERASDLDLMMQRRWKERLDVNPYTLICPLALFGIILTWRRGKDTNTLNLLILSQLLFTLIFFLVRRHRTTILPILIIYEAYTLFWVFDMLRQKNIKAVGGLLCFFCGFLLIFRPVNVSSKSLKFITHTKAGPVYESLKDYSKAQNEYLMALDYRQYDTNALFNLGNTFLYQKDYNNAEKAYLMALQTCHYNVDALFNLGFTYQQTWKLEKAIEYFSKVLKYQPNSVDALYRIAQSYETMGDCRNAKKTYQKIITLMPRLSKDIRPLIAQCAAAD